MDNLRFKFRIWNGSGMEYNVMVGFLGAFYVQGMDEKDAASMSPFNTKYHESISVMQYTNLKDINDKEIYEGDLVKTGDDVLKVIFNAPMGCWDLEFLEGDCVNMVHQESFWVPENFEIIGNIYENPLIN